jgi:hypothetical protein
MRTARDWLDWLLLNVRDCPRKQLTTVFNLWDRVEPRRDGRSRQEEAAEYAAATAKHLFDRVGTRRWMSD